MTDHLPECQPTMCRCCDPDCESCETCICDRLRACKKRVLIAVREAISKIPKEDGGYCHVLHACDVEAAIDALKEKP